MYVKKISYSLSLKNLSILVNESYGISKVKNVEKIYFSYMKSFNKKVVIRKYFFRICRKFRFFRNYVNVGSFFLYVGIFLFLFFYGDVSDLRMWLLYF